MRTGALYGFLLLQSLSLNAQIDQFVDAIAKVKLSIVPVACATTPDKTVPISINAIEGTGFFVSYDGDFVTAAHVVSEHFKWNKRGEPDLNCFPVIYVPNPTWESARWFEIKSCTSDEKIDVSVCRTVQNPFADPKLHISPLHLAAKAPEDGTPVAFTGFPQFILIPVTSRANIAASGPFFDSQQTDIMIDKTTWHGVSGGPLYLADGTVIGIIRKTGEGLWAGMGFARQISSVSTFLTEKHITIWDPKEEKKAKKPK